MGNKLIIKPSSNTTVQHVIKRTEDIAEEGSICTKKIYASMTNRVLTNQALLERTQPISHNAEPASKYGLTKTMQIPREPYSSSTENSKKTVSKLRIQLNTSVSHKEGKNRFDFRSTGTTSHPKYKNLQINIPDESDNKNKIEQCLSTKHSVSVAKDVNFKGKGHLDKFATLPASALASIMFYSIQGFRRYLCVSPGWYISIKASMDQHFNCLENLFVSTYSKYLNFRNSYTSSSLLTFTHKPGIRLDRCIIFENFNVPEGYTLRMGYEFVYHGEKMKYKAEFEFDCVNKRGRHTWIYHTLGADSQTISQHTIQIPISDCGEIAVNIYSLRGLINIDLFKWLPPFLYKTPYNNVVTNYQNKRVDKYIKSFADLNRICELEDLDLCWYDSNYISNKAALSLLDISKIKKLFSVESTEFAGMDGNILKLTVKASCLGIAFNQRQTR